MPPVQTDSNTVVMELPPRHEPQREPLTYSKTPPLWSCVAGGCEVRVVRNSRDIDPEIWRNAFSGETKDRRYYELVEETLHDQFDQRYFVITDEQTKLTSVQPFFFVEQDLLAGLPAHFREMADAFRKRRPGFLKVKMLTVGCAAGEGQLDRTEPVFINALHDAVQQYALHEGATIILLKDFPSKYRGALERFAGNSFARVPSMPGGRLQMDFSSFEEYMQQKMGKVFRKNLRRKLKEAAEHSPVTMEVVNDATPFIDEIHPLYMQTYERSQFRFERLTKEYLCAIGKQIPERTRYFIWRQQGRIIAFALCLVHGDTLCDMNVGMDYSVALDMHLYFLTFRDIIQWAVENGLKNYTTGPLNYDPKFHLRLDLEPLDLYARHASPWINPFLKIALKYLQPARHDKVIPQFRNAHEIY